MKFACDVMLGKLAKYLRILGHDATYARNSTELDAYRSRDADRIILTRRKKGRSHERIVYIDSEIPREQLLEIKHLLKPASTPTRLLHRCIECNVELKNEHKAEVEGLVPEFVFHNYSAFKICPSCKRVYWEGSHLNTMAFMIKEIMD